MRNLLKQVVTINRPTATQGNNLGIINTYAAVYSGVAASVQPASSSVMDFYAQRQLKVTQTVFIPNGYTILRGDTITFGTFTLQVIGFRDLSGRSKVTAIDCEIYE